jgi:hypothetical protein
MRATTQYLMPKTVKAAVRLQMFVVQRGVGRLQRSKVKREWSLAHVFTESSLVSV